MGNVIEDLIENNKLIAEFCGFKKHHEQDWYLIPKGFSEHISHNWQCLSFHTSFDWLMPVVQKIKNSGDYNSKRYLANNGEQASLLISEIENALICIDITRLWLAVIEFIKWYNLQNK